MLEGNDIHLFIDMIAVLLYGCQITLSQSSLD